MNRFSWEQRIERAEELARTNSFASELLGFYREIACFQQSLYAGLDSTRGSAPRTKHMATLLDSLDAGLLLPWFPRLIALVERVGPPPLAQAAGAMAKDKQARCGDIIAAFWKPNGLGTNELSDAETFFARALLQPFAEFHATKEGAPSAGHAHSSCPVCERKPQVGVLRPEGYGARRSFLCSLCSTEWDYPRVMCPACGEQRSEKLAVYTAGQFEHVRVEACDSCKTYFKTIDLTKDGLAIPVVDELAATPLDLWAREKGYRKLQTNLLGL